MHDGFWHKAWNSHFHVGVIALLADYFVDLTPDHGLTASEDVMWQS